MNAFFNIIILAGLTAIMWPGSTGRFFISTVRFASTAFNLLIIGWLFFTIAGGAAVGLYNEDKYHHRG